MARVGDPRLGELLNRPADETSSLPLKLCFIGYPCDIGVRINQGRTGCRLAPEQFRNYTKRLCSARNPETGVDLFTIDIKDLGDSTVVEENLQESQKCLEEKVLNCLNGKYVTVVIGGGKDLCYPLAKAFMRHNDSGNIGVVNVDSHLDVRPLINGTQPHSGSAFYQLLEDPQFKGQLIQFGTQGSQNSSLHTEYLRSKGGQIVWLNDTKDANVADKFRQTLASLNGRPTYVSFELDAIKSSDCPGVSCPGVVGFTGEEALEICQIAGETANVQLLDLTEYNPEIECDRTARLLVNMFYYFAMGVAKRHY